MAVINAVSGQNINANGKICNVRVTLLINFILLVKLPAL